MAAALPERREPARPRPVCDPSPRSVPWRGLSVVGASIAAIPLTLTSTGVASEALLPKPARALPSQLDAAAPYQGGYRCLTGELPGVVAFAKLLNATYGSHVYGIWRRCAMEHGEGRALDWMVDAKTSAGLELGNRITRWLAAPDAQGRPGAMARRFGINYIIWNRQTWRAYDPARGWTPYYGVSPHTDHIHISFTWDGAYGRTSWWTGVPVVTPLTGPLSTPQPVVSPPGPVITASGYPWLRQGHSGTDVALAQRVVGATPDGAFGPRTAAAVAAWQRANGVPVTSEMDNATWSRMVALKKIVARVAPAAPSPKPAPPAPGGSSPASGSPLAPYAATTLSLGSRGAAVVALQKALGGLSADGSFGPLTQAKVKAYQSAKKLPATGDVTPTMWKSLMGATAAPAPKPAPTPAATTTSFTTAYTAVKGTTLRLGAKGDAVKVLQRSLGGLTVDGGFGPLTEARVKAVRATLRLSATGVADPALWKALEARDYPLLAHWTTTLKRGSSGAAVVALQKALRISADGGFGPQTEAAVKAAQAKAKIAQTGVVALLTWQAVEKQMVR